MFSAIETRSFNIAPSIITCHRAGDDTWTLPALPPWGHQVRHLHRSIKGPSTPRRIEYSWLWGADPTPPAVANPHWDRAYILCQLMDSLGDRG
jgi:hypothetical protein